MINEFSVPVPWGHIAVKTWGDEKDEAVLVAHGRLDNAGAFDRLIPLLPASFYYICIDLPGHGKSSHFPPHLPIYTTNFVLAYKLLVEFFKRQSYIIIGHSYGGQIGFLYAQLYPMHVKKLIMLETVHMYPVNVKEFKHYLIDQLESNIDISRKLGTGSKPKYTQEEALSKLLTEPLSRDQCSGEHRDHGHKTYNSIGAFESIRSVIGFNLIMISKSVSRESDSGRQGTSLTIEAATPLFKRAVEPVGDGKVSFTYDQRMKSFINPLHDFRYIIETLREDPVTCPVLIVLGLKSLTKDHMEVLVKEFKRWNNISIEYVDDYHDVHNNNPGLVAPIITKFLLTEKAKL